MKHKVQLHITLNAEIEIDELTPEVMEELRAGLQSSIERGAQQKSYPGLQIVNTHVRITEER